MNQSKAIPISILSGLILGLIGVHLMGYVAAIAIPKEYFLWFKENLFIELRISVIPNSDSGVIRSPVSRSFS